MREDQLNVSMAAGEMCNAASEIIAPINTDCAKPADLMAVLILSAGIDGWNWRRALMDGQEIANEIALRWHTERQAH